MNEISPAMMPAVAYRKSLPVDEPDSLLDVELPVPQPGPRDLLVQVEAIAVNPVDYKIRQSADPGGELRVLGWDAAGTVAAVGGHVELFQAGDEVYYSGALDRLADAGILTSTATQDLGPVNAANLRRAHRVLESGTAIGKTTLTGFQSS
jgi:NADPH:quinone reductase-like Zn-dependent oxidoreductase